MKTIIKTSKAPEAIGPYSQAVEQNGFVFVSGQIPLNPVTHQIEGDNVKDQTKQVCENLVAVLKAAGCRLDNVVKTTCYLKNMSDFTDMNEVYSTYFSDKSPARATVAVSGLPRDVLVEIDAIAICGESEKNQ